ncbi:MAG TPA: hypothetical protein DDX25_01140 [Firmicutes bacterium]|jgi:hypothetical protein|nr:hypothetical protein [Bacillota bacterium]
MNVELTIWKDSQDHLHPAIQLSWRETAALLDEPMVEVEEDLSVEQIERLKEVLLERGAPAWVRGALCHLDRLLTVVRPAPLWPYEAVETAEKVVHLFVRKSAPWGRQGEVIFHRQYGMGDTTLREHTEALTRGADPLEEGWTPTPAPEGKALQDLYDEVMSSHWQYVATPGQIWPHTMGPVGQSIWPELFQGDGVWGPQPQDPLPGTYEYAPWHTQSR